MQHVEQRLLGIGFDDLIETIELENDASPLANKKSTFQKARGFIAGASLLLLGISLWVVDLFFIIQRVVSAEKLQAMGLDAQTLKHSGIPYTLGGLCVVMALSIFYTTTRNHYSQPSFWSTTCPICHENELIRIPRNLRQRLAGVILQLPFCNYDCSRCDWDGVRVNRDLY